MNAEQRLQTIERELAALRVRTRRLRMAVTGLGAVATLAVLGAAAPGEVADVVRARRFEVVSGTHAVVILAVGPEGEGQISTHNSEGHPLIAMRTTDAGDGALMTFNRAGYQLVELGQATERAGTVSLFDGKGVRLAALTANREGDGEVRAYNRRGHLLAGLRGTDSSGGALYLRDASGRDLVSLGLDAQRFSTVRVYDGTGAPSLWMGMAPNEGGYVTAYAGGGGSIRATWPEGSAAQAVPPKGEVED